MTLRQTHTFVTLPIPQAAFDHISKKLIDAGYAKAFMDPNTIDMHGIALVPEEQNPSRPSELIMRWFENKNLPPHLQEVVAPWKALAEDTIARSDPSAERSTALRKLLEGKDAAVRAVIAQEEKDEKHDEQKGPQIGKRVLASGGAPLDDGPKRLSNFMGIAGDQSNPRPETGRVTR